MLDRVKGARAERAGFAALDPVCARRRRTGLAEIRQRGRFKCCTCGHRTNAYGVALREMGESYSALQAAQIHGYIKVLEPGFDAQCRRILGTLVKLALPDRR